MPYVLTLVVAVIIVVAFFYLAWAFTRFVASNGSLNGRGKYITVLERFPVGRDSYLLLVKNFDRLLLVGVTPQGMTTLREISVGEVDLGDTAEPGKQSFSQLLSSALSSAVPEGKLRDAVGRAVHRRKGGGDGDGGE